MNAAAAKLFAQGFLKGYADVIGAMLSSQPDFSPGTPQETDADGLQSVLTEMPLVMEAAVSGGGAIVFVTTLEAARRITSAVMGDEGAAEPALTDDERATMKEIFDPCMGGGVSHFKEKYEKVIELQPTEIRLAATGDAEALLEALGESPILVTGGYEIPEAVDGGQCALLFSQALESTIPESELGEEGLDAEVQDIVQESFGASAAQPAAPVARDMPGNINMILDIGLNVTARLGRIEMPLGQVLELGPGSIIEVGHSVDEPVELLVNNKLIARGDVVVVEEKFGLRITEIISPSERIESLR